MTSASFAASATLDTRSPAPSALALDFEPAPLLLGYVLEWAFYSYLYEREHLQQVLMTYGLILVFEELRSILVDDDVHGVQPPDWKALDEAKTQIASGASLISIDWANPWRATADVLRGRPLYWFEPP